MEQKEVRAMTVEELRKENIDTILSAVAKEYRKPSKRNRFSEKPAKLSKSRSIIKSNSHT